MWLLVCASVSVNCTVHTYMGTARNRRFCLPCCEGSYYVDLEPQARHGLAGIRNPALCRFPGLTSRIKQLCIFQMPCYLGAHLLT
ncbi:hypothetical protein F5B20DRAFT_227535 [Whalleya microplaca]|nr:hypothetical protein F5B20DRAFT_227535 [Whalleya microplaca]